MKTVWNKLVKLFKPTPTNKRCVLMSFHGNFLLTREPEVKRLFKQSWWN